MNENTHMKYTEHSVYSVNSTGRFLRETVSGLPPSVFITEMIGQEILEQEHFALLEALHVKKVRSAFREAYDRGRTVKWTSQREFARIVGLHESTVSRYLNGQLKKTPPSEMDKHLRKIGTRLANVLPTEYEETCLAMEKTLPLTTQKRLQTNDAPIMTLAEIMRQLAMVLEVNRDDIADSRLWDAWLDDNIDATTEIVRVVTKIPVLEPEKLGKFLHPLAVLTAYGDWHAIARTIGVDPHAISLAQ